MTSTASNLSTHRAQYESAISAGRDFLAKNQSSDGAFAPAANVLSTYYKTPQAFLSAGASDLGIKLLQWVKENGFADNGDFNGEYGRGQQGHNAVYPNGWMTLGAHRLGMYDISMKAMDFILTQQNDDTGGFYRVAPHADLSSFTPMSGTYGGGIVVGGQDLLNTSMAGLACLTTGHIGEGIAAGNFLVRMLEMQPDRTKRFYFQMGPDQQLVTEFPEEQGVAYMLDGSATDQNYFQIGISAAFLSRLYSATSDHRFLDAAKGYLDSTIGYAEDKYRIGKSGKIGWGAAYVYRLSGDLSYLEMSLEVGQSLCEMQASSGAWVHDRSIEAQIEVTSEFVTLLAEMREVFV